MLKVKVAFGEDIRHWHYPTNNRYQDLVSFVEKILKLDNNNNNNNNNSFKKQNKKQEYYFQFEDAEMDKVTIGNEQDLLDAFECAEQEKRPSLKIFVIQGSINDTHEGPAQEEVGESDEIKPDEEAKLECEERNCCEIALEFVLDEKINVLFPELIRRVVAVLREDVKNGKEASLIEVVPRVLEEKAFEPIVQHELYQKHAKHLLPIVLTEGSCCVPMLLSLNEATVGTWVSDMLKLITMSLGNGDHGLWHMHTEAWRQQANNEEAIHHGVACDGCGVTPIRGARYKCAVCPDYDLCEKCESSKVHYNGHPLVKMARPMCRRHFGMNHFQGLAEVMGRRCRRKQEHSPGVGFPHRFGHCHGRRGEVPHWMRYICKNQQPMCSRKQKGCEKEKDKDNKKKCKLENRKEKLLKKLTKINSKLNGDEEMKTASAEMMDDSLKMLCICGAQLVQITAMEAYRRCTQVICDKCSKHCSPDEEIFHCPVKRSPHHRAGFDVCWSCATANAVINSEPKPEEAKCEEPKIEQPKPEVPKVEQPKIEQPKVEQPKPEQPKPEQPKPEEPKKEEVIFPKFLYTAEARAIVEMGFTDQTRIASLLLSKKGNVEQVLAELLSQ